MPSASLGLPVDGEAERHAAGEVLAAAQLHIHSTICLIEGFL
jgi:hypothetical protein